MKFKDHFSGHAAHYAQFRPRYPKALFSYLASIASGHDFAWDCATGNGQAAIGLAAHFRRVVATDASAEQIENAERHPAIEYRAAPAEASAITAGAVALVTVAQALHWFDIPAFFAEAQRVSAPGGVVAVWAYHLLSVSSEVDPLMHRFYSEITAPFWPPERAILEAGYRNIEFPFDEITPPRFEMRARWKLDQLLGYLRTWSATQRYIATRGSDPVIPLGEELREIWGGEQLPRMVRWPLAMRVGIKPD